ncbi:hypothetical protein JZU48_02010, partial [bacterium]|nr:hypothetical protein [bacterium]
MTASGVCFICVVNLLIGYGVWLQREETTARTREHADELAKVLEIQTRQTLAQTARLADDIATVLQLQGAFSTNAAFDVRRYLIARADAFPQINDIVVIDPDGDIRLRARDVAWRADGPPVADLLSPHRRSRGLDLAVGAPI